MRCPDCDNTLMQTQTKRGKLHQCDQCLGMWFDRSNFEQYSLWLACEQKLSGIDNVNYSPGPIAGVDKMQGMPKACPLCHQRLEKVIFGIESNIIIDKCKRCKGIWVNDEKMNSIARHIKNDPDVEQICKNMQNNRAMNEIDNIKSIIETIKNELGSWV